MILEYVSYVVIYLLAMTPPTQRPSSVRSDDVAAYDKGDVETRTRFLWEDIKVQQVESVMANSHNDEMQRKPLVSVWVGPPT
jgi:hypothetical protein